MCAFVVDQCAILDENIKPPLPEPDQRDPFEKLLRCHVADVFQCQVMFDLLLDDLENRRQQG